MIINHLRIFMEIFSTIPAKMNPTIFNITTRNSRTSKKSKYKIKIFLFKFTQKLKYKEPYNSDTV